MASRSMEQGKLGQVENVQWTGYIDRIAIESQARQLRARHTGEAVDGLFELLGSWLRRLTTRASASAASRWEGLPT